MTLQELVDRALSMASAGMEPSSVPTLHAEMIAEDMLPAVFGEVGQRLAANERTRHLLRRTKTLAVVNGAVQLSADTLSAYITDSVLTDADDETKDYSYLDPVHFVREPLDSRLGHYSVVGESGLRVLEPGEAYAPLAGPTASYLLTIPCVPEVPATAASPVVASEEVIDELVTALATALRPILPKFRQVKA